MKTVDFCGIFKLMLLVLHSFNALQWLTSCAMICTTEATEADTFNERDGIGNEDNVKQSNTFVKKIPLSKLCWLISYRGYPHRQVQQHNQSPFNWQFGFVGKYCFFFLFVQTVSNLLVNRWAKQKSPELTAFENWDKTTPWNMVWCKYRYNFFNENRKQSTKTATINENVKDQRKCERTKKMSTHPVLATI